MNGLRVHLVAIVESESHTDAGTVTSDQMEHPNMSVEEFIAHALMEFNNRVIELADHVYTETQAGAQGHQEPPVH